MQNYILYGVSALLIIFSLIKDKKKTKKALIKSWKALENILPQFLGIITLVGIMLAILNPQVISQIIGSSSGWWGVVLASVVGAITLIPGFIAFPTAALLLHNGAGYMQIGAIVSSLVLMKKGAKFTNILLFIGAWSTTKIPMLLFELSSLGAKFTLTRLAVSMAGIFIIAFVVSKLMSKEEVAVLYDKASATD